MKIKLTFFFCVIFVANATGQFRFSISGFVGNYAMADMLDLQEQFVRQQQAGGFSVTASDQFPITPQIEVGAEFQTSKRGYWGSFFNYTGTRGVAGYGSPPWLIQRQQNLSRFLLGVKRYQQLKGNFYFVGKAGLNYSKLNYQTIVDINSNNMSESNFNFHSWGASIQPGFSWLLSPKSVGFEINFGYEVNIQGETQLDTNSNYNFGLFTSNNQHAKIDWSGFRLGVGLTFSRK